MTFPFLNSFIPATSVCFSSTTFPTFQTFHHSIFYSVLFSQVYRGIDMHHCSRLRGTYDGLVCVPREMINAIHSATEPSLL